MELTEYGITRRIDLPYGETVARVRAALMEEGFGVLTEIDVKKTLKEKLNQDFKEYVILGACNPPLAHRALSANPFVGLLLPCNVIVYDDGGSTVVSAIDPASMMAGVPDEALHQVADDVKPRLERVMEKLASQVKE